MGTWRSLAAAVAVLPLAACAFGGLAARAPKNNGMGRPPSQVDVSEIGVRELEGKVVEIDSADGRLLVEHDGRVVELRTADEATVFVDGAVGGLADLQEGAVIRASFEEEDGSRLVRWIEVPRSDEPTDEKAAEPEKDSEEEEKE